MTTIPELKDQYESLDRRLTIRDEGAIDTECLLGLRVRVSRISRRWSAWTQTSSPRCVPGPGFPMCGTVTISYVPHHSCIELKSLKYYLLSFRDVGIVQEHAANRILKDLVNLCRPRSMNVTLDYKVRGGIHCAVSVDFPGE